MLLLLLNFLRDYYGFKIPALFDYCSTRMALAAVTSLAVILVFGKFFIKKLYEWKIGDRVRTEECPLLSQLHHNKNDTPTMGGILILFSLLISLLLWMDWKNIFTLILLFTTLVIGVLGATDDYLKLRYKNKKGVKGKRKMLIQLSVSAFIACYLLFPSVNQWLHHGEWFSPPLGKEGQHMLTTSQWSSLLYVPFFKHYLIQFSGVGLFVMFLFMLFVMTGASNAVNLTDGLDGLATGTVMLAAGALSLVAFVTNNVDFASYLNILYIQGSGEIAVYLAAIVGASLGFLWYNAHPAQVFMGDTGSLPLGAILGVSALLLKKEFLLGIIGFIFVAEALSVILQVGSFKFRNKKRLFLCAPLHHHFEYKGWTETKVVVRFWIIGLLCAIVGIISLKFQ